MKDKDQFYQVDNLRVLDMETLRVYGLERGVHWVFNKEMGIE